VQFSDTNSDIVDDDPQEEGRRCRARSIHINHKNFTAGGIGGCSVQIQSMEDAVEIVSIRGMSPREEPRGGRSIDRAPGFQIRLKEMIEDDDREYVTKPPENVPLTIEDDEDVG
jgi:hypothetical protein